MPESPVTPRYFGALHFSGPQARDFLQGQVSHDLRLLTPQRPLLAAHNTAQGRVVAVLRLFAQGEDVLALAPATLIAPLLTRLRKYVLRTKVTISAAGNEALEQLGKTVVAANLMTADANAWQLQQIAAGQPYIYPETSEFFVAQMLNLDLLDGISFTKGCYTGQEIIARAHYRGHIKRRMLRFQANNPGHLERGTMVSVDQGRRGRIVEIAQRADGAIEFLAVVGPQTNEADAEGTVQPLSDVLQLSLPYAVPQPA